MKPLLKNRWSRSTSAISSSVACFEVAAIHKRPRCVEYHVLPSCLTQINKKLMQKKLLRMWMKHNDCVSNLLIPRTSRVAHGWCMLKHFPSSDISCNSRSWSLSPRRLWTSSLTSPPSRACKHNWTGVTTKWKATFLCEHSHLCWCSTTSASLLLAAFEVLHIHRRETLANVTQSRLDVDALRSVHLLHDVITLVVNADVVCSIDHLQTTTRAKNTK